MAEAPSRETPTVAQPGDSGLKERIEAGHYARKQFLCKDRIISWSHGTRFRTARTLVEPASGGNLLDYGCGDGSFVAMVADLFPLAVGADLDAKQTAECADRFSGYHGLRFLHTSELDAPEHTHFYNVITCMEVLEHCVPESIDKVLADLGRLLAPGGRLIISVPIEIGPSLLGKELVRTLAAWRKLGDYAYKERYRPGELAKMALAGERTAIPREPYPSEYEPGRYVNTYGHKGFNWKALRRRIRQDFDVTRTRFSPMGWTRGLLSSQAWLICTPKGSA